MSKRPVIGSVVFNPTVGPPPHPILPQGYELIDSRGSSGISGPTLVKIKRLHPSAVIPSYATDGSACFDITALDMVDQKGNTAVYTTGLAFEVPPGKVLMLYSRSGHGFNRGIRLANCVGVIDSDYRGEVAVKLTRDNDGIWFPAAGERIAQGLIQDAARVQFVEVEELSDTERGTGGFGSTG